MNKPRRNFIRDVGLASAGVSIAPLALNGTFIFVSAVGQRNILRKLVMINDKSIETLLQSQINDPGNRYDGAANNRH
ncbi:MAG: hypothetical protein ACI9FN_002475, partial [Saprospiraceae bacterium]